MKVHLEGQKFQTDDEHSIMNWQHRIKLFMLLASVTSQDDGKNVENILKRSESFTILACIFYLKKWYPGQS
jgi:hypothetical protein